MKMKNKSDREGAAVHSLNEGRVFRDVEKLRDPKRLAWLESGRVVSLSLEGMPAGSVLDIGTGSGIFAEAFARKERQVTGIDLQEAMVAAARRLVPGPVFQVAACEDLPFAADSFALCFLGLVLHETDRPLPALREARRVCASRTAVLEWPHAGQEVGPPLGHRLSSAQVHAWGLAAGFARIEEIPLATLVLYLMEKQDGQP
jgi:SAM-dependent methyltransferase